MIAKSDELRKACIRIIINGRSAELISWLQQEQYMNDDSFTAFFNSQLKTTELAESSDFTANGEESTDTIASLFHQYIRKMAFKNSVEESLSDFLGFDAFTAITATNQAITRRKGRIK